MKRMKRLIRIQNNYDPRKNNDFQKVIAWRAIASQCHES